MEIMKGQRLKEAIKENERDSNFASGVPSHQALMTDFYGLDEEVENEGAGTGRAENYEVNLALGGYTKLEPVQE